MITITALGLISLHVGLALVILMTCPSPKQNDRVQRLIAADLKARQSLKALQHTAYTGPLYSHHGREIQA